MKADRAALAWGRTWHRRLRPVERSFSYPVLFLWLPMRRWREQGLAAAPTRNRFGPLAFHDADHGLGGPDALAWIEGLLQSHGLHADGEIWLQTLPRVWGFAFKPVSFWHVEQADGRLAAVLAEVNNTFGERHCYLLRFDSADSAGDTSAPQTGRLRRWRAAADKVFHVSPFCDTRGRYSFEFDALGDWRCARVNLDDAQGPLLRTSLSGRLQPYSTRQVWRLLLTMPWAALAVVWRIHWQALQLWWHRLPLFRQPPAPAHFVSE
ncbi:MAG: DUF1365 domain-containing protein [Curvibacter sp.]|nr:DUF1365 domain-containing protein [Curvibacter sp.]